MIWGERMCFFFEISKPFLWKVDVYKDKEYFRIAFLWFAFCIVKCGFTEMFIRERIGKKVSDGEMFVVDKEEYKNIMRTFN